MKLKQEQILYIRSMGKALKVTGIFTSVEQASLHCSKNKDDGVVAEFTEPTNVYIFTANVYDKGVLIENKGLGHS